MLTFAKFLSLLERNRKVSVYLCVFKSQGLPLEKKIRCTISKSLKEKTTDQQKKAGREEKNEHVSYHNKYS